MFEDESAETVRVELLDNVREFVSRFDVCEWPDLIAPRAHPTPEGTTA